MIERTDNRDLEAQRISRSKPVPSHGISHSLEDGLCFREGGQESESSQLIPGGLTEAYAATNPTEWYQDEPFRSERAAKRFRTLDKREWHHLEHSRVTSDDFVKRGLVTEHDAQSLYNW